MGLELLVLDVVLVVAVAFIIINACELIIQM